MKKILLFTSILFLTITTSLFAQTTPSIANVFVSDSIDCYDGLAGITIEIIQTTPPTAPLEVLVGYYLPFSSTFLFKKTSASIATIPTIVIPSLEAEDYIVRLIDPVLYYAANPGGSGSSLDGVYHEYPSVISLTEPAQLKASTSIIASNLCAGECIAAEDLLIEGGTGPYSFMVNGGTSQNLASGVSTYSFVDLCEDSYNVIVTDANACSTSPSTTTFIISPIDPIIPAGLVTSIYSGVNVSCNGFTNGEITAAATGSAGSLEYSIDSALTFQSSTIFSNLAAGTYTVTYKDANGCIETEQLTLIEPPALSGTASVTQDVDCYSANTGEITFTVDPTQPGIPIYQYSDDNGSSYQSSAIFPNLLGDINYDIMVMDNNACQFISTVYLAEPAQIIYATTVSNYNGYQISCAGNSDGTIEFTNTIGGLAPYEYSTDGGLTFDPAIIYPNLSSGTYNIEVKDASGCIVSSTDTLDAPGIFSVPYVVSNAIDCPGNCNGAISINPSNGVAQVIYTLDNGSQQTTPYFSGICGDITNGSYTLDAIDDNGCTSSEIVSLAEPTDFVYTTVSNLEYCDQSNGQASITVTSGGTGGLSYLWNNDPLLNSSVANNLVAGTYTVVVTDGNSCQLSETVIVSADIGFTISFTTASPCLGDSSGGATVSATGIPAYSYQWSDINGVITGETSATISGMPIGTYSVEVTDATSCVIAGSVDVISQVDPIIIDSVVVTNSSCFGINDAQIEIFASGGDLSYNYSNTYGPTTLFQNTSVFGSLAPNTYILKAFDANGCFDDTIVTLSYPGLLEIDSTVFTHISCFGLDDGAVQNIQFVGGTGPFEFSIDGNPTQTYMLFSGLEPGQHTVEVFDINNCATSDFITVTEPTLFEVGITVSDWNNYQIMCNGDNSGYVDIQAWGGTAPYITDSTSFWNSINIDSISAGIDTFIVQDANGCEYQEIIVFNEPSPIQHNFIATHVSCVAWNNGAVTDSVYGGVGSSTTYSYLWDSGETTYSLANLSAGTYTITVTDENGCEDTESVVINASNAFNVNQGTTIDVGCFDDCDGELSVTTSGGVPFSGLTSYTYLWNDYLGQNTDTAVGLCVDSISLSTAYSCIVSDAVGCTDTVYFTLIQPAELQVDVSITSPISCNGLSDGKLKANVTGGELAYTYTWSNGGATSLISNLSLGIYKVIVEDANTCRDTFEIYLNEPTLVEISIQEFDISCFGDNDGYIEVLGTGGTSFEATYSYTLYSGAAIVDQVVDYESGSISQTPFIFSNLSPGNYYVIAKDRNGCDVTSLSVEITEPFEPLTIMVDSVDETCQLNDGIIRIFPEGGSQSFNFEIDGNPTLNNSNIIGGNAPGWYAITVIDTRGCEINDAIFIKDYQKVFMPDTLSSIDTTICLGQSITIDVDESPYLTYAWNDGVESGDRTIELEGTLPFVETATVYYTLTITDANNCEQENIVVVNFTSINPMIGSNPGVEYGDYPIVLSGDNLDLFSENNNGIEYTWQWSNDVITNASGAITIQQVSETDWYYLKVKDADGCLGYDSIYVVVGVLPYEAITPNNDGFNDTWTPLDIESYQNALVQVFNRWGGLVYESSGGNNYQAWDGTNNGKELAVGTYYYIIDLNTGDEPQTGPVTIIR